MAKRIACIGDPSDHGGTLTSSEQDGRLVIAGVNACANGCNHSCPITGHGVTSVTAATTRTYVNNKLIITEGAVAGCGAHMTPPDRKVYAE